MNNVMLFFMTLLALKIDYFCTGMSNPSDVDGDPAPGRSPGPPEIRNDEHGLDDDLPTILLTSDKTDDVVCSLQGDVTLAEEDLVNITVHHELYKSDIIVPGVIYQVIISRAAETGPLIDFSITSAIDGIPVGEFYGAQLYNCGPHIFRGHLMSSKVELNWTLENNREFIKSNITFLLNYMPESYSLVYILKYMVPILQDCQLHLIEEEAVINDENIPYSIADCQLWFPTQESGHGLVVELRRLNVPCSKGFIHFSGLNVTQHQHFRSHRQAHICGKLEELSESDRLIYFPSSHTQPFMHLHGNPVFSISYRLVDYCYNITFVARNGSFDLKPTSGLECTFKIYLPYGNRVALNLKIGDSSSTGSPDTDISLQDFKNGENICDGLLTQLQDGDSSWSHCTKSGDAEKQIEIVSRENKVVLKVIVHSTSGSALGLSMSYRAEPVETIVGVCEFGWILLRQFCVAAMESAKLPWAQAEMECTRRGGHLASVRSNNDQTILDNLLINSPGYHDYNSYWIGASDKIHEGDFRWSDGLPFSYTNWFSGWAQHGHYNKQPNDDGLSEQDCVEVRRVYSLPSSSARLAPRFMWNDRDCSTPNYFICERLQNDESLENSWMSECNKTMSLSRQHPKASVTSPGFPRQYPDNANCKTEILTSPGYRIILDFEELVLENEPSCSYDYLIIVENTTNASTANSTMSSKRLCGDWSSKLKLLRYVSQSSRLILKFSSDYSHHFGGYKARVSMENAVQCADDRLLMFNNFCYLIVSYPEATWETSQQICDGLKATLASILSPEEEKFVTINIRKTVEYRTSALYWLGARTEDSYDFKWIDGNEMEYSGWLPGQIPTENDMGKHFRGARCLSLQWTPSPSHLLPSGLYWRVQKCNSMGGYICKRRHQLIEPDMHFNRIINGTQGRLSTPNYPENYYDNLDFSVKLSGPDRTRLVIKFEKIDIESQVECLYDYIEIKSVYKNAKKENNAIKWCGTFDTEMNRFDFVSETNEAKINFHSDYSISGSGFSLIWYAVDISSCPMQTLTAKEGTLMTPNYPHFLLAHLDCSITILAPKGKRIWLEFLHLPSNGTYDELEFRNKHNEDVALEINLGKQSPVFKPFETEGLLTDGTFVSAEEKLRLRLKTGDHPQGNGFRASYKITTVVKEEKIIILNNYTAGTLLHLNYPDIPPANIDFIQHLIAPLGSIISLELYDVKLRDSECSNDDGLIEVYDNYSDTNGTLWKLCSDEGTQEAIMPTTPIYISSFLNTLHLRQKNGISGIPLNGSLRIQMDENYKSKLLKYKEGSVESCNPNPCQNGGKCLTNKFRKYCQCTGHYTGLFCGLTKCELEPCAFGTCELTNISYKCHCKSGYMGPTCDRKRKPCEGNPCESRGTCLERGDGFQCQCHAWWEGSRCEKRMLHIPYKPLSERMLHEPFWLGLMTVFVVMGVIGLVWCAKRHFPEKIEKLLAEEDSRNRISSLRSASVREQLAAAAGATAVTINPSPGPGAPRSLFGRLGIRKPSILSLTSPHASGYVPATARTFSLDDLLKPPPRRTPSPKKKRNNSTPTKKNIAEKKQILQQLISPVNKQNTKKVNLGELIQLSDMKTNDSANMKQDSIKMAETKFGENAAQTALNDPKLEKKVTFARLLNKVSAEMSSGSEMELGIMQTNKIGCMFARPASTPPSPGIEVRSPNSTSSNQGSDSLTSSDLAIPSALSSSISDILINRRSSRLPSGRQKPASADSILAMFRNFSSSSAGANLPSSLKVSPSTTPTASSPQDDIVGDDESSTSSIHTPVSFSSGPPESPIMQHHVFNQAVIEVPVLDPLSAHKSSSGGGNLLHPPTILLEIPSTINKCLSPIREMPTPLPSPMPSPALTPVMRRSVMSSSLEDADLSDDRISIEIPNISVSCSDVDDDEVHCSDIVIDPHAEDGLILEEAASMHQSSLIRLKNRPSPLGQPSESNEIKIQIEPPPLVIPTLTIQTPSPTHSPKPTALFPGSPPPHKSQNESCFQFPTPKQSKKLFKDFEKPTSLDLPCAPPMITITCNLSEVESDTESPAIKPMVHLGVSSSGMTYLSPFSMNARGDHTASESNLSSSGYSSMASPGPSRCSSNNPLCPSEMEDHGPGSAGCKRRQSLAPAIKLGSNPSSSNNTDKNIQNERRGRSDSETLSDDPLLESNDEGIGTDHIDEKIDDGELKSAKELEVFMIKENDIPNTLLSLSALSTTTPRTGLKCLNVEDHPDRLLPSNVNNKNSLQLPSIVVQFDSPGFEKHLSPMSSRSESPLSDRTSGMGRFSPQFYGKNKDILPFTDSDGLYDFPSSDKVNVTSNTQHKKVGRKREKKLLRNCKTPSPTKSHHFSTVHNLLDVPNRETLHKVPPPRKLSPKRRITRSQVVSSSSSSDSITSAKENKLSSSSPSPDTIRWSSPVAWMNEKYLKTNRESLEDSCEELQDIHSSTLNSSEYKSNFTNKKVSRLRAISHQIRFLRRLELGLKKKERTLSPSESFESGEESPRATSPLLQHSKGPKVEICKSSSISKTQKSNINSTKNYKRGRHKRGELLLPQEIPLKVTTSGNGFSD